MMIKYYSFLIFFVFKVSKDDNERQSRGIFEKPLSLLSINPLKSRSNRKQTTVTLSTLVERPACILKVRFITILTT